MARFVLLAALLLVGAAAPPPATLLRFDGELASGDRVLRGGEYYDTYTVRVPSGQRLRVTMHSEAFDTYLIVKRPGGEQEDNDDAGGSNRSQIVFTTERSGPFEILATSYRDGATGRYTVIVEIE